MNRIKLSALRPGQILNGPLYDSDQTLLLSKGHALTSDILTTLQRRGREFVLLGKWEEDGFADAPPTYSDEARDLAEAIEARLTEHISPADLAFLPAGKSLDAAIDRLLQPARSVEQIAQWKRIRQGGVDRIGEIMDGSVPAVKMAETASTIVEGTIKALSSDPSLIAALLNLKGNDGYLYAHSMNTVILSMGIATELKYNVRQIAEVGICAIFHDIGMMDVDSALLASPYELTQTQRLDVQKHTGYSLDRLAQAPGVTRLAQIVAHQHHERLDGTGYPHRREGPLVHRATRIVSVADVYDALASKRPWREAFHPNRVMRFLLELSHENKLDKDCVKALLKYLSLYPIGTYVMLSTGETARVVHANGEAYSRPVVRIVKDAAGAVLAEPITVDLMANDTITIVLAIEKAPNLPEFAGF